MSIPKPESWVEVRPEGLYVRPGRFHVDPTRPVEKAVITHGHADHARAGHKAVLATPGTLAIMAARYGVEEGQARQALAYGEPVNSGEVELRL
ncbi:MAG: DNA ligase-associated DEXH box helicase, partial [Alphaproteobacteria bacterium]|nr:DNA ligase-associated DEXH box helicase [Alphaproteobacteria bacterium]